MSDLPHRMARAEKFIEESLTSVYFDDPIQLRAFELINSGTFNDWSDIQKLSSVDDQAVVHLVRIGLLDLKLMGGIFYKENVKVVEFAAICTGPWNQLFVEQMQDRVQLDPKRFSHFDFVNREACLSVEGAKSLNFTRRGDPYDARWHIREQWGEEAVPDVRFVRFSTSSDSEPATPKTAVAVAKSVHPSKPSESPAIRSKPRKPTLADRSAFWAIVALDQHIERCYQNAPSSDLPTTQQQKRDLIAQVIDTWELAELKIHDDWKVPRTGKDLFEASRRFERWIDAGNSDIVDD